MRTLAWLCALALATAACGDLRSGAAVGTAVPQPQPTARPAPTEAAAPAPAPTPQPTPAQPVKLRVFVSSEGPYHGGTGDVHVLEGSAATGFEVVKRIPQGGWPHNVSLSPDLKYVAVAQRSSNQVSVIDPIEMKEIARFPVGRTPHGITWSPDSKAIYVAHERDHFIGKVDVGTWKMTPIQVGVPQHVTVTHPQRPHELWFTLTNTSEGDVLRVYSFETKQVTRIRVGDVHDIYFTPDFSELWSSSSGFLEKPSDRMVIYDPETKQVKETIRLPGHYPFHGQKLYRDGQYFLPDKDVMLISSHWNAQKGAQGASLLWVDWKARKVVGETPLGRHVFHMTYDPLGHRVLATSNVDGMVNVIDAKTRQVVQKVPVPKAHGIVAIGIY
ncbi:MAG TPA: hypothetical protein VFM93_00400 [Candidatus Limnocylindria bacterium]|nr:hypothetical protein [Candidatus Limnocylindria bacterium]